MENESIYRRQTYIYWINYVCLKKMSHSVQLRLTCENVIKEKHFIVHKKYSTEYLNKRVHFCKFMETKSHFQ